MFSGFIALAPPPSARTNEKARRTSVPRAASPGPRRFDAATTRGQSAGAGGPPQPGTGVWLRASVGLHRGGNQRPKARATKM